MTLNGMFATSFSRAACSPFIMGSSAFLAARISRLAFQPRLAAFSLPKSKIHMAVEMRPRVHNYRNSRGGWGLPVIGLGIAAALPLSLGASALSRPAVQCEVRPGMTQSPSDPPPPPPPRSSVNAYELTFGTVCGICAGVFIKKGAKMLAFVLGGVFVLLQYFSSLSLVHVDWDQASDRFNSLLSSTDPDGKKHPPSFASLWNWLVNFLVADFQQRASFIAGLALGLRIG